MIVWTGRGIFSVLILIPACIIGGLFFSKENIDYGIAIGLFLGGAFNWYFGKKWNNSEGRTVIDEKTGQKFILKTKHTLFWIKMEYWGFIFGIIGLIILFQKLIMIAMMATVIYTAIVILIYLKNNKKDSEPKSMGKKVEPIAIKNPEPVETEEERRKRRLEKEDPSRFMPH